MSLRIETTSFAASIELIQSIRQQVFIHEQGIPAELEWDHQDHSALFVLAYDEDGHAIGTGRLLQDGRIGRMAVLKNWRGRGIGNAMLQQLIRLAQQNNLEKVYVSAQTDACGFYARAGFVNEGSVYTEAGIPHRKMSLLLSEGV